MRRRGENGFVFSFPDRTEIGFELQSAVPGHAALAASAQGMPNWVRIVNATSRRKWLRFFVSPPVRIGFELQNAAPGRAAQAA